MNRNKKMPASKTSSLKIMTTIRKSSTTPKPYYPSRERPDNNMRMVLKNLGRSTKHSKRAIKLVWKELRDRFGVIITHFKEEGKNLHPTFEVVHKEMHDLYAKEETTNKATYTGQLKSQNPE